MFFRTAYVLFNSGPLKLETEGQTIYTENFTEKLQN